MPSLSRRNLLAGAGALALGAALAPSRASALAVYCSNCSTIWQQMQEYAHQVQQLATQVQSYRLQIQQYTNMVQNTIALPQHIWNMVNRDILMLKNIANLGSLLSGNAGGLLQEISTFSTAVDGVMSVPQMIHKYDTISQTIGRNIIQMQTALGVAQNQMENDAALVQAIQAQSSSAQGQVQVLQAANQFASVQIGQTMKLHQTMMASNQMLAAQVMADTARKADEDAAMVTFMSAEPLATTGGKRY